ncbi:MAG TPA: class I SAM-dependent methyltransferase [Nitriliruptorales bacterium]|nr:class I SAM-dependent methyltransferase [Nitriliruptorales bacterium]
MARREGNPTEVLPASGRAGKDAAAVQAMFDRVAPRYDLVNTVVSLGQDAHWRRVAARAAAPGGARVLDVAAGTGGLSRALCDHGATGVVALDLSYRMLAAGRGRQAPLVRLINGDALRLPFPAACFDAVTIAFGLRNLPDQEAGLREFARVTRPGGRLVVLEFSTPTWRPFRVAYQAYLAHGLPRIADVLAASPAAYRYLSESILLWPDQETLAGWIATTGWEQVSYRNLAGGIVAVHRARRRSPPGDGTSTR